MQCKEKKKTHESSHNIFYASLNGTIFIYLLDYYQYLFWTYSDVKYWLNILIYENCQHLGILKI